MAKKSKKKRAKKQSSSPVAVAEIRHASGMRLRADSAPSVTPVDDVEVEVAVPSQRDVEEALAAVAEEQRASQRVAVAVDIHLASDSQFFSGLSGDISE